MELAGEFKRPVALSQFPLSDEEISSLFGSFDQDYHISRYFHFTTLPGKSYLIGGEPVTHLFIDKTIEEIL